MRHPWFLAFAFSIAAAAQTPVVPGADKPDAGPAAGATSKPSPIAVLRAADEAGRGAALIKFLDAQLATNAVYSGQFSELGKLPWDATPMLRGWLAKAPEGALAEDSRFREGCINALRDCVDKAPDELVAELEGLAATAATPERVAICAKYALAQFGKSEHVDAMIEAAKKGSDSTDIQTKVESWSQLADIYYNIRRYEDAAKAHGTVIAAINGVNPGFRGLPSVYYNCACSYALSGNKKAALEHLTKALQLGKQVRNQLGLAMIKSDMDIRSLRSEPEFAGLMKDYYGIEPPKAEAGAEPTKKEAGK
ncbi:MAG: tetratricopeptide repeat protein [Planctomycetes bacterium]|nr:tetratricopeptide repeat protein [Planctomycetota bacterium]